VGRLPGQAGRWAQHDQQAQQDGQPAGHAGQPAETSAMDTKLAQLSNSAV
jgi:hypothetical protein